MARVQTKVKKIPLSIAVEPSVIEKINNEAKKQGVSRSELVVDIIIGKRKAIKN